MAETNNGVIDELSIATEVERVAAAVDVAYASAQRRGAPAYYPALEALYRALYMTCGVSPAALAAHGNALWALLLARGYTIVEYASPQPSARNAFDVFYGASTSNAQQQQPPAAVYSQYPLWIISRTEQQPQTQQLFATVTAPAELHAMDT
jgi:hypothetical protein